MDRESTFICPVCGEELSLTAKVCPECGSCDKTGWSENTLYDGLDLPDDEMNEEKREQERMGLEAFRNSRTWTILAILALLVLIRIFIF